MAVGAATFGAIKPVAGFRLGVARAGIRKPDRRDLVIMELAPGSTMAGTFTLNQFCAAPVQLCRQRMPAASRGSEQPIYWVTNTGFANAGTGAAGMQAAQAVCAALGELTQVAAANVFPFSTGVIGEPLPVDRVIAGLPEALADLSETGWEEAANGIMTTDTRAKGYSLTLELDGKTVTLSGISKGAGMIRPNMATMLGYVATDAAIAPELLQSLAVEATHASFNVITVDSDTSTNDCCMLAATGQSGVRIDEQHPEQLQQFKDKLIELYQYLAHAIVRDGEGATKFVTVAVDAATSVAEAREVAFTVAHSPLVKTALFASDPNWGRILAAVGRADIKALDVEQVSVTINGVAIARGGARAAEYDEALASAEMAKEEVEIRITLGRGDASATVWTSDLSYEYVRINADYRS